MLGTRTKQVSAYGRRGHRIVNVTDDRGDIKTSTPFMKDVKIEDDVASSATPSLQPIPRRRNKQAISSPTPSPPSAHRRVPVPASKKKKSSPKAVKVGAAKVPVATRHPLGLFPANVPGSPALAPKLKKKRKQAVLKVTPLKTYSPIVNVDIVVLDAQGRRLSQERRVSRSDVQVNKPPAMPSKAFTSVKVQEVSNTDVIVLTDSEEELVIPKPRRRGHTGARTTIISSDESDSDNDIDIASKLPSLEASQGIQGRAAHPQARTAASRARPTFIVSPSPSLPPARKAEHQAPIQPLAAASKATAAKTITPRSTVLKATAPKAGAPVFPPPAPEFIHWTPRQGQNVHSVPVIPSPHPKARQLTPLRYRPGRPNIFPAPPSPPSPTTPTDFDFSLYFSQLGLSSGEGSDAHTSAPAAYLQPLLEECVQTTPHEFSAFIEMFPFDPIVQTPSVARAQFQKIGEASYSEVFGIGDVVLKVIPLRDESANPAADDHVESPASSDAKDVLKEIIVTRAMGEICAGFVKLLRAYVVRGKYPSLLLDLWDEYNKKKGSEGIRPDSFTVSQVYAIIVLPNGGPDLETFTFEMASKTGWRQACSLFWQIARTLAEAEELVRFEHRDLHWGQILVKSQPVATQPVRRATTKKIPMDHATHGIQATVIDLGLARMDSGEDTSDIRWTPFDEEIFEGEGDYQFDIYRLMRVHNRNSWEDYRPLTNVMWLHYLAQKLLHFKRLRAPVVSRKSTVAPAATFTERECYQCLVEVEEVLARCLATSQAPPAGRKGRRKTQAPVKAVTAEATRPQSAADVVQFAIGRGWVR